MTRPFVGQIQCLGSTPEDVEPAFGGAVEAVCFVLVCFTAAWLASVVAGGFSAAIFVEDDGFGS